MHWHNAASLHVGKGTLSGQDEFAFGIVLYGLPPQQVAILVV
jgi:hypothetical protein